MKKSKNILLYSNIFLMVVLINRICFFLPKSVYKGNENTFYGKVISITENDKNVKLIIKAKEKIIVNYYDENYKHLNIQYGDYIYISGNIKKPPTNTTPNLFNYKKYLLGNKIFWI
ncbi:MAG TPA: DUF4131 domain-containing protein, partial [Tenericutes bacterium]|nr:DUF4131 domain-containing protein [Mycoplasmatota bacterium]